MNLNAIQSGCAPALFFSLGCANSFAVTPYINNLPVQVTSANSALAGEAVVAFGSKSQVLPERQIVVPVITAPLWLRQRMEDLQQRPPPTLQEVETAFRAAEETRAKYEGNPNSFANGRKLRAA